LIGPFDAGLWLPPSLPSPDNLVVSCLSASRSKIGFPTAPILGPDGNTPHLWVGQISPPPFEGFQCVDALSVLALSVCSTRYPKGLHQYYGHSSVVSTTSPWCNKCVLITHPESLYHPRYPDQYSPRHIRSITHNPPILRNFLSLTLPVLEQLTRFTAIPLIGPHDRWSPTPRVDLVLGECRVTPRKSRPIYSLSIVLTDVSGSFPHVDPEYEWVLWTNSQKTTTIYLHLQ